MSEILKYIFRQLNYSEKAIKNIQRSLRGQSVFALSVISYALNMSYIIKEQNKKIDELKVEIEELKQTKGGIGEIQ